MELENIDFNFGKVEDTTRNIIKVVGVGGGGCNAVKNMFEQGIADVSFANINTDSKQLANSKVPVNIALGPGYGAGAKPEVGQQYAEEEKEQIERLFSDGTKMVFVTAGMGGGTGTGAAPVVADVAMSKGILTIGVVTIPFYFEKRNKIIKALKGVEEMRKNVDALLIVNNERINDIYGDTEIPVKEAFKRADNVLCNAVKSISELITIEGDINLDFKDVEATMKSGGGAIMAIGKANGKKRVSKAFYDALDSPLLYGSDIGKAKRILFNIYTSPEHPIYVNEIQEIDSFMDSLDQNIEVIWGLSTEEGLGEDAKVAILATGLDDDMSHDKVQETTNYDALIEKLYKTGGKDKTQGPPIEPKDGTTEGGSTNDKGGNIDPSDNGTGEPPVGPPEGPGGPEEPEGPKGPEGPEGPEVTENEKPSSTLFERFKKQLGNAIIKIVEED